MKKKIIIIIAVVLTVLGCFLVINISTSNNHTNPEKEIVGKYYHYDYSRPRLLEIRSNGTYNYEDEYGTGKWHYLNDGSLEFIDSYGENYNVSIGEDEQGKYVKYSSRTFYKQE